MSGNQAHYCPHTRCFDCNNFRHATEITPPVGVIDPHLGIIAIPGIPIMIIEIGTGSTVLDPTHTTLDIGATAIMTPIGAAPDHSIDLPVIALHAAAQAHTTTSVIHHTADHHPVEISPKMTAGPEHTNTANNIINQPQGPSSSSQTMPWKNKDRRHNQVTIDDPPSEYYSSDEQDSDSEDDLN